MAVQHVEFESLEASKKTAKYLAMTILVVNLLNVSGDQINVLGLTVEYSQKKFVALLNVLLWASLAAIILHWTGPIFERLAQAFEKWMKGKDAQDTHETKLSIDPQYGQDPPDDDCDAPPPDDYEVEAWESLGKRVEKRSFATSCANHAAKFISWASKAITGELALLALVAVALVAPTALVDIVAWEMNRIAETEASNARTTSP